MLRFEMRALEGQELAGRLSHICAAEDFLSSYRGDMFPSLEITVVGKNMNSREAFIQERREVFVKFEGIWMFRRYNILWCIDCKM